MATQPSSSVARTGHPSYWRGGNGRKSHDTESGGSWEKGQPSQPRATLQPKVRNPQQEQGATKSYKPNECWQC